MREEARQQSPGPVPQRRAPPREGARPTNEKGRPGEVFNHWSYIRLQDRAIRERELAELMVERQRQALAAAGKRPLRARVARKLFALAVALDRRETWSVVWERLEAKGRL